MNCQCDRPSAGEGEGGRGKVEGPAAVMGAAMGETHLTERARRRRLVLGIGIALLGGLRPAGDGILVCRPGSLLLRRLSAIDVRQSISPSSQSATTTGSQCQARREEGTNDGRRLQRWEGAPDKEGGQGVGGRGFVAGEAQQGLKFRGGGVRKVSCLTSQSEQQQRRRRRRRPWGRRACYCTSVGG